ncbi:hypothetical protein GQ600_3331 [Phytophthora cactorum]|nr:hypothetical protein GQ600_3331 [Phytophthora cactorum]
MHAEKFLNDASTAVSNAPGPHAVKLGNLIQAGSPFLPELSGVELTDIVNGGGVSEASDDAASEVTDSARVANIAILRERDKIYAQVDSHFIEKGVIDLPCPGLERKANRSAMNGVVFEMKTRNLMPFSLQKTGKTARIDFHAQESEEFRDTLVASYFSTTPGNPNASGAQVRKEMRMYAEEDSAVFIWKMVAEPKLRDLHTTKFFVACATEHEMDSLQATLDYIAGIDLPHTDVCAETELLAMIDEESALAFGDNIDHSSEDDASLATLDKLKRRVPSWKTSPCASRDDGCSFDDSAQCLEVSSQPIKRRQRGRSRKAELEDLRKLSAKLSDKIESMKASAAKVQEASKNDDGNAVVKTMWTDIALRQLMLRQAAEAINAKLRNDVVFHAKHAKNLKRMLKRRYSEEVLSKTAAADQRVFRELMRDVNQVYTSVDTLVANKGMANLPCPGREQKVNPKTVNGLFIELMDKNLVPFSTAQTSQAVWKAMCGQKTRDADIVDAKV